jgi:hypothetical protein
MNQNFSIYLKKINLVTKSHQTLSSSFFQLENLAEEGSILFCSKQIKQDKPNELPINIVVFATTSQILAIKATGYAIKKKYEGDIPTNITAIKYFEKAKKKTLPNMVVPQKSLFVAFRRSLK